MAQQFDHTWLIYKEVIEETIKNSATLQSDAVLAELRNNWLRHLSEHLKAQQGANDNHRSAAAASAGVKNEPLVRIKKELPNPLSTGVSPSVPAAAAGLPGVSNVWCPAEGASNLTVTPTTNVWAGMNTIAPQTQAPVEEEHEVEKGGAEEQEPVAIVVEDQVSDQDDDWGNWEDPVEIEDKQKTAEAEKAKAAADLAAQAAMKVIPTEACQVESALAQNPAIPKDDDFTTTLRTQYGTSTKAGFVDDPDDVNSDLEELSSLSDHEPEATDYIIGQCEELIKPGGRKAQVQGTWKICLRGGIASISGREFLFDRLEANLDF